MDTEVNKGLKQRMIAKGCKRYVHKLFQQEEPNRHDEDLPAVVHYSICHSQIMLARPLEHTHTHTHHGAFYVSVSQ